MTTLDFKRALKAITRDFRRQTETEVRKRYREQLGLIYVKPYSVPAHFRRTRRQ